MLHKSISFTSIYALSNVENFDWLKVFHLHTVVPYAIELKIYSVTRRPIICLINALISVSILNFTVYIDYHQIYGVFVIQMSKYNN